MRLRGCPFFKGKKGNPITSKQRSIIREIESKIGVKFRGKDSRSAYYFIKKHHWKIPPNRVIPDPDFCPKYYFRCKYRRWRRW